MATTGLSSTKRGKAAAITVGGRQYRFCAVCRGDDAPFIRCAHCSQPSHFECANLALDQRYIPGTVTTRKDWICAHCVIGAEDGNEVDCSSSKPGNTPLTEGMRETKRRLQASQSAGRELLRARKIFFGRIRSLLQPFCNELVLNRISCEQDDVNESLHKHIHAESPPFISVKVRDYQLAGINKMYDWYLRGVGGILADEMGLGKTIQTISFLASLKEILNLPGPHLVITPLAVLQNWANEITRFCPTLTFIKIYGQILERGQIMNQEEVYSGSYDVYLTTYETVIAEEAFFSDSWTWVTVTIDEGHRIKNENAVLRAALNRIRCPFRLLLTGTPLQNNLHELWALLNYLIPDVFAESSVFDEAVHIKDDLLNVSTAKQARALLEEQMMIRRVKRDVEKSLLPKLQCKIFVPMSSLQVKWYKKVIEKDYTSISMLSVKQMLHIMSQLRKVVNHPKQIYLKRLEFREREAKRTSSMYYSGCEFTSHKSEYDAPVKGTPAWDIEEELRALKGESLVQSSGKLAMLDRLLIRLKRQGSRVLLFSQFTETMDVLEEYITLRFGPAEKAYLRLDGQTNRIIRELNTRSFNAPNSSIFIYLISTKAGGVGLNLATADSVVLYDSCWNPQADLQAQDRAHRIGQTKQVTVYRLITKDSVEERIDQMSERKMILDQAIIAKGKELSHIGDEELNEVALSSMIGFGAAKIMNSGISCGDRSVDILDTELDAFIRSASTVVDDQDQVYSSYDQVEQDTDDVEETSNNAENGADVVDEDNDVCGDSDTMPLDDVEVVPRDCVKCEILHEHFLSRPPYNDLDAYFCFVCKSKRQSWLSCARCDWYVCQSCSAANGIRAFFPDEKVKICDRIIHEKKPLLRKKFVIYADDWREHRHFESIVIDHGGTVVDKVSKGIDCLIAIPPENVSSATVEVKEEETTAVPISKDQAKIFLCEVKTVLSDKPQKFNTLLELLRNFKNETTFSEGEKVLDRIRLLLKDHVQLIEGLNKFLPLKRQIPKIVNTPKTDEMRFTLGSKYQKALELNVLILEKQQFMESFLGAKELHDAQTSTFQPVTVYDVNNSVPSDATYTGTVVQAVGDDNYDISVSLNGKDSVVRIKSLHIFLDSKTRERRSRKRYEPNEWASASTSAKKQKKEKTHESLCFSCCDGGELLECSNCPKVYHIDCLGYSEIPKDNIWICPWHQCLLCNRRASNAGGLLFRCMTCPITYCFDCFPKDTEIVRIPVSKEYELSFTKHGFTMPTNMLLSQCKECIKENRSTSDFEVLPPPPPPPVLTANKAVKKIGCVSLPCETYGSSSNKESKAKEDSSLFVNRKVLNGSIDSDLESYRRCLTEPTKQSFAITTCASRLDYTVSDRGNILRNKLLVAMRKYSVNFRVLAIYLTKELGLEIPLFKLECWFSYQIFEPGCSLLTKQLIHWFFTMDPTAAATDTVLGAWLKELSDTMSKMSSVEKANYSSQVSSGSSAQTTTASYLTLPPQYAMQHIPKRSETNFGRMNVGQETQVQEPRKNLTSTAYVASVTTSSENIGPWEKLLLALKSTSESRLWHLRSERGDLLRRLLLAALEKFNLNFLCLSNYLASKFKFPVQMPMFENWFQYRMHEPGHSLITQHLIHWLNTMTPSDPIIEAWGKEFLEEEKINKDKKVIDLTSI